MTASYSRDRFVPGVFDTDEALDDGLYDWDGVVPIDLPIGGAATAQDTMPGSADLDGLLPSARAFTVPEPPVPNAQATGRKPPPPGVAR